MTHLEAWVDQLPGFSHVNNWLQEKNHPLVTPGHGDDVVGGTKAIMALGGVKLGIAAIRGGATRLIARLAPAAPAGPPISAAASQRQREVSKGGQYLFDTWHRATFNSRLESIRYHLGRHGRGRSAVEYTRDAMRFFSQHGHQGKPVILRDGTAGVRIQTKLTDPSGAIRRIGGFWTEHGKLVTFWD